MTRKHVYSVTDRFDLMTVFVATVIWAILLTLMRLLELPHIAYWLFFVFLFFVGLVQYLFRKLNRPRLVSVVAGIFFLFGYVLIRRLLTGWPISLHIGIFILGALYGYIAGACVSSAFLISDLIRSFFRGNVGH